MRLTAATIAMAVALPAGAWAASGEEAVAEAFARCLSGVDGDQITASRVTEGLTAVEDSAYRVPSDTGDVRLTVTGMRCAVTARGVDGAESWRRTAAAIGAPPYGAGPDPLMQDMLPSTRAAMARVAPNGREPAAVQTWRYQEDGVRWSIAWVEHAQPTTGYALSGSVFLNDAAALIRRSK